MKHDLTTGAWQDDTGCPISIILAATSDVCRNLPFVDETNCVSAFYSASNALS